MEIVTNFTWIKVLGEKSFIKRWVYKGLCCQKTINTEEDKKGFTTLSNIRQEDFRASVTLVLPPLNSETGWTGELWSKTNLLNWQNKDNSLFSL